MSEQPAAADNGLRIHEALKLAEGFGFPGGLHYYDELDPHGMAPLLYRLTDGAWHATGRRVRDGNKEPSDPEVIPAKSWDFLIPDAHTDSASGGNMNFCAIRIYRGAPSSAAKQTSAPRRGKKPGDGELDDTAAVAEAIRRYETGEAKSRLEAARMVGHLAARGASLDANVDRVRRKVREKLDTKSILSN